MMRYTALLVASLLLAGRLPAQAPNSLQPGARALSFAIPELGSAELGAWRMRSPDRLAGLFLQLAAGYHRSESGQPEQSDSEQVRFALSLGPQVRRYLDTSGRVAPFWQTGVGIGYSYDRGESVRPGPDPAHSGHGVTGLLQSGIGLEWFPVREVSVSGFTGLRLRSGYGRHEAEAPRDVERWDSGWHLQLETFTSTLFLSLYLPRDR